MFGWGIRQITGYFEDLWESKNLDIAVPSFGNLSDLFASLSVEVKQFCNKLRKKLEAGEDVSLILDATALRFGRASYWYETKYSKPCKNRPWSKMHMSMDPKMNIHSLEITDNSVSDIEMKESLLPEDIVNYIKAKGTVYAFYTKYGYGVRALIEAQFSRIKRCIGNSLLTEKNSSKKTEGIIIGNIINLWNSFGQCESVKIG